ncbi:beta-3 adrenergic receptor-like [Acropora millepora]|uniref:beta-3 adrenergic receptor-like n=1 Tax=Acropora millepora TaxID=45264 RepID=UPI001CF5DBA5|nr:beta-3 adrenergic receptor-like [Acropora millepora]
MPGASLFNQTSSAVKLPNQRCLVTSLPEHAQNTLRDVTNFVVLPLDTLLALLSFTCNIVIVVAVLRTQSIQRPSLLLLCSLATTNIIWAILSTIHNTKLFILNNMCQKEETTEEIFLRLLCFFSTLASLAVISCDRLLAVNNPWWYRNHATKSLTIKQIVLVWVIAVILSSTGGYQQHNDSPLLWSIFRYLRIVFSVCFALTIIGCYIGVLIVNCRHRLSMDQYGGPMRTVLKREKQVGNTVGLILLVFCLTLLPAVMAPIVFFHLGFVLGDMIPLRPFILIFATFNGILNSLVNYGRNKNVRRAVRSLIRCQRCCRGEVLPIGEVDNGRQSRDLLPWGGRNNKVTVDLRQIARLNEQHSTV